MSPRQTVYERRAPGPTQVDAALRDCPRRVFWIDALPPRASFAPLTRSRSADLTVVGGGFLGLWTAVLAKRRDPGRRVVLLEAESLGWAASGRNGGFCEPSLTHGDSNGRTRWPDEHATLERLGAQNLAELVADVRRWEIDCGLEQTGMTQVAVEPHQVPWLRSGDFLDREAVRKEINSPIFLAGRTDHDTVLLDPARLVVGLARVAAESGVEIHEHSGVVSVDRDGGDVVVSTARAEVRSPHAVLATNAAPSLVRQARRLVIPVYDYVLVTEPLSRDQMAAIGWQNRQGFTDLANQFHYSRLTSDNRILYGGYDAIYHPGGQTRPAHEERASSYRRLAAHFLTTFPQLEGVRFTHRWAGVIDACTRFAAFHGLSTDARVAWSAGFTGLGVAATRFAANVMLDRLAGTATERTEIAMVRDRPTRFPPEPILSIGVGMTKWSLDRADHNQGKRNVLLRTLDRFGLGFDS